MKKTSAAALLLAVLFLFSGCCCFSSKKKLENDGTKLSFTAEDIRNGAFAFSDLADRKVIMINFFETWCNPCMRELPDLEKLYEQYKDEGFVIIGVFGSSDEAEVLSVVNSMGISYPVVKDVKELSKYRTDYVPTTVFLNGSGELLSDEAEVGAKSFSDWEELIISFLNK